MARQIGAPLSLRELGMPEEGIGRAADLALRTEYANPRPATLPDIERLLSAAWSGDASYVLSYR